VSESKQRWRLVFGRDDEARYLSHLDAIHLWERALRRGDIPVATSEGFSPRPKLIFAAPLPLGMLAEHDLGDLFLAAKLARAELREHLAAGMPRGYRLIDLRDEWVGAPALATQLVAADYRMTLLGAAPDLVEGAVGHLLAARELRREKRREKKTTAYDLRPLLIDLQVRPVDGAAEAEIAAAGVPAAGVWVRLRNSQELGIGRAEEVAAAMADELGMAGRIVGAVGEVDAEAGEEGRAPDLPEDGTGSAGSERPILEMIRPVRERLWLAEELAL
jgi:radical SAM-linked protein